MNHAEFVSIALSIIGIILIPILAVALRTMVKWVRTEDQLQQLVDEVKQLVTDKDKVHSEILGELRADRDATNTRLRYLEEYFMGNGMRGK